MFELLQTLSRAFLAFLSGATLIFGTVFIADAIGGIGSAFGEVKIMLHDDDMRFFFIAGTGVTAYIVGIVIVAGSNLAFSKFARGTKDDLWLVGQLERLQRPQFLKETLDILHIKRTLVAFTIPLLVLGAGLIADAAQWEEAPGVPRLAGTCLIVGAIIAPYFACRMTRMVDAVVKQLADEDAARKDAQPPAK